MDKKDIYKKAKNIWERARINCLAHKLLYEKLKNLDVVFSIIQILFSLLPMVLTGVIFALSDPNATIKDYIEYVKPLSLCSAIFGGISLLASYISAHMGYHEKKILHQRMHANYALLAQKARKLDDPLMIQIEEAIYFIKNLEEEFEAFKAIGEDPSDRIYRIAQKKFINLNGMPSFKDNSIKDTNPNA